MPRRRSFDKLSIVSACLFACGSALAIGSLCFSDWVVAETGAKSSLGLLKTCIEIRSRGTLCESHLPLHASWSMALLCILLGIVGLAITVAIIIASRWKHGLRKIPRWFGFASMLLFCLAAVLFPVGFSIDAVGGQAYQLPNTFKVGFGYIFFVTSLWLIVIAEVLEGKVCLPRI